MYCFDTWTDWILVFTELIKCCLREREERETDRKTDIEMNVTGKDIVSNKR